MSPTRDFHRPIAVAKTWSSRAAGALKLTTAWDQDAEGDMIGLGNPTFGAAESRVTCAVAARCARMEACTS